MTVRSEGQFNTVVYEEEDIYRGQERRDVIMMAAADTDRLGLAPGDARARRDRGRRCRSRSPRRHPRRQRRDVLPGGERARASWLDARSRTPAFKSITARVRAVSESGGGAGTGARGDPPSARTA